MSTEITPEQWIKATAVSLAAEKLSTMSPPQQHQAIGDAFIILAASKLPTEKIMQLLQDYRATGV